MWLTLVNLLTLADAAQPAYPVWPDQFQVNFVSNSTIPLFGTSQTTGTYIYDWKNKKALTKRADGHRDRYCALNGFQLFRHEPCDQYVVDGDRYIDYPESDSCCYCCSEEHGCGMIKPTWLDNATYLGEVEVQGQKAYKWNQKGLQDNIYIETQNKKPAKRKVLSIYQEPNDLADYDPSTFKLGVSNDDIVLPDRCQKSFPCIVSICSLVRSQQGQFIGQMVLQK